MDFCSVVDIFCGVGGLTHGFVKEGFRVLAGFDSDETCRYAFEKNNSAKFIKKDVKNLTGKEVNRLYGKDDLKILVGCAPCAPFSKYNAARHYFDGERTRARQTQGVSSVRFGIGKRRLQGVAHDRFLP
jgi:site-specific DNA-cytosine methylase